MLFETATETARICEALELAAEEWGLCCSEEHEQHQQRQHTKSLDSNQEPISVVIETGLRKKPRIFRFRCLDLLGNGSFGIVAKVREEETGQEFAIKKVFQDKNYQNREVSIMLAIGMHPNIVRLEGYFYSQSRKEEDAYLNLVMEYSPSSLYRLIKKKHKMNEREAKKYSKEMFQALAYLHNLGICHRDIKPQNLLISTAGNLQICDFGSAKQLKQGESNIAYICSRYYRAPECLLGGRNYSVSIDVWAAGCVIGEMLLGIPLFCGKNTVDQLFHISQALDLPTKSDIEEMGLAVGTNMQTLANAIAFKGSSAAEEGVNSLFQNCSLSEECIDFLQRILMYSPKKRIKAADALKHPFLAD
jgi:glycogen synthase kinase 3 beta